MSIDTPTTMPDKYRPDPTVTAAVSAANKNDDTTPSAKLPVVPLRDWLHVDTPTTLSVAPRDDAAVRVGHGVADILDSLTVSEAGKYNKSYPTATFPLSVLQYLGVEPGDRIRVDKISADVIEVSPADT